MWPFTPADREEQKYRSEEQHRRAERKQWGRQNRIGLANNVFAGAGVVIAIIAAGGAVFAAIYAHGAYIAAKRQAGSAEGQLEEAKKQTVIARTANRAWLDVNLASPYVEVKWDGKDGPSIKSYYTVANIVSAPAIYANEYVVPKVSAIGQQNELNWAKDACAQEYGPGVGTIITQRNPLNSWSSATLQQTDIDKWREIFSQQSHVLIKDVRFFSLTLIVCAIYKTVGDDTWHHTARMYQVGELGPDGDTTLYVSLDHDLLPGKSWSAEQTQGGYVD